MGRLAPCRHRESARCTWALPGFVRLRNRGHWRNVRDRGGQAIRARLAPSRLGMVSASGVPTLFFRTDSPVASKARGQLRWPSCRDSLTRRAPIGPANVPGGCAPHPPDQLDRVRGNGDRSRPSARPSATAQKRRHSAGTPRLVGQLGFAPERPQDARHRVRRRPPRGAPTSRRTRRHRSSRAPAIARARSPVPRRTCPAPRSRPRTRSAEA